MFRTIYFKRTFVLFSCLCTAFLLSACGATLQHVSSPNLKQTTLSKPVSIMLADIGDVRVDEPPTRIGQGVSYWLPISYYANDENGKELPVSYYIAKSLGEDLGKIGYETKLANDTEKRTPLSLEESIARAKEEGADYLVTTKVKEGKTNFWGFIVIPFFEPVWTRIGYDSQLIDMNFENEISPFQTHLKTTEWYFAKITILDAIFDAGLFGKHWHSTAWGKTIVSSALAETAQKISEKIQAK